jgi:hypothetical protein
MPRFCADGCHDLISAKRYFKEDGVGGTKTSTLQVRDRLQRSQVDVVTWNEGPQKIRLTFYNLPILKCEMVDCPTGATGAVTMLTVGGQRYDTTSPALLRQRPDNRLWHPIIMYKSVCYCSPLFT